MDVDIEQATPEQLGVVAGILEEAAAWAERTHGRLWDEIELAAASIRREIEQGQFFIARCGGEPAGTLRYQREDAVFWPDAGSEAAAYVHRLAVRRRYAGRGVAAAMLRWAADRARAEGRTCLRLDADMARRGLHAFYEACGFEPHSERIVGPYHVMRYEQPLIADGALGWAATPGGFVKVRRGEIDERRIRMKQKYDGSCHCGKVRFEATLDPAEAVVCDCSICRKKGVIIGRVSEDDFNLLTPLKDMTLYQFNKRIAKHYFCPVCGIHTFNRPRSAPELWAVNLRCLAKVDLDSLSPKQVHGSRLD